MQVAPEVSSLDYSNGVVLQRLHHSRPSRRAKCKLKSSWRADRAFAIAGLLDNRFNETLDKIPGIGNIPLLGKLFQSQVLTKNNSELLIMVTPELVRPIPVGTSHAGSADGRSHS